MSPEQAPSPAIIEECRSKKLKLLTQTAQAWNHAWALCALAATLRIEARKAHPHAMHDCENAASLNDQIEWS